MANLFDKIATKATSTSKKSDKIIATTTEEIQLKVDALINTKAELKRLEATQADLETAIIEHVKPQQDELAYCGQFTKSLVVPGTENQTLTFVTMDKFTVPQDDETLKEVKKLVGDKYDEFFASKNTISIKDSVDDKTRNKIVEACTKAGLNIADLFDNIVKIVTTKDLDQKQYELSAKKLATFRTFVKQAKPALK